MELASKVNEWVMSVVESNKKYDVAEVNGKYIAVVNDKSYEHLLVDMFKEICIYQAYKRGKQPMNKRYEEISKEITDYYSFNANINRLFKLIDQLQEQKELLERLNNLKNIDVEYAIYAAKRKNRHD